MVQDKVKVMIGVPTGEWARRPDFYDYLNMLDKPIESLVLLSHDRSPAHSRNLIIEKALELDCTHVLFIDDDMAFRPNALIQLLGHNLRIVSGLYLSRAYPHPPLIFDFADKQGRCLFSYLTGHEAPLKRVVAAGLGFVLIKTEVFKKLEKPWIRLGELDSEQWCDDLGFFNRVARADIPVFCDTNCQIGHIGSMIIWPNKVADKWYIGYDTGAKGMINTPFVLHEVKETQNA